MLNLVLDGIYYVKSGPETGFNMLNLRSIRPGRGLHMLNLRSFRPGRGFNMLNLVRTADLTC